jgi:hypothetical protein
MMVFFLFSIKGSIYTNQLLSDRNIKSELKLITTIASTRRIDHFSWSTKTNISAMKPVLQYGLVSLFPPCLIQTDKQKCLYF